MSVILGLDPGLTSFGAATLDTETGEVMTQAIKTKPRGQEFARRFGRYYEILDALHAWLPEVMDAVFVEHYSFNSKGSSSVTLGEFGGVLRNCFYRDACTPYEVPPSTLKKFIAGKGNADKSQMRIAVYKRWGFEAETSDEIDAYGLCRFGEALLGLAGPGSKVKRAVIEKFRKEHGLE